MLEPLRQTADKPLHACWARGRGLGRALLPLAASAGFGPREPPCLILPLLLGENPDPSHPGWECWQHWGWGEEDGDGRSSRAHGLPLLRLHTDPATDLGIRVLALLCISVCRHRHSSFSRQNSLLLFNWISWLLSLYIYISVNICSIWDFTAWIFQTTP